MNTSTAINNASGISTGSLQWHPRFNAYIVGGNILLVSEKEQLFLSTEKYLFLSNIDGNRTADEILAQNEVADTLVAARFHYQIMQLKEWTLLVERSEQKINQDVTQAYLHPAGNDVPVKKKVILSGSVLCWLSRLNNAIFKEIESLLTELFIKNQQQFQFVFVDDFLDSRLNLALIEQNFIVIKISGDNIWISPLFSKLEFRHFERLQQRILDNQPLRKMFMLQSPDCQHGYPFKVRQGLTSSHRQAIGRLLFDQIESSFSILSECQLIVYSVSNNITNYHAINPEFGNQQDFSLQITSPVHLQSCIGNFNLDGGLRCQSAQETVGKLSRLVSPITGIINHFIELPIGNEAPVKIFRTAFYKSVFQFDNQFDQNNFVQTCLGKGMSSMQSKASALAEAVERYCASYQPDIPSITSTLHDLLGQGKRALTFQDLQPYSERQYQHFSDPSHPDSKRKQAVRVYDNARIHWLPCYSLVHNEQVFIPLTLCFNNIPFDDYCYGRWNSNGCAAGNSLEEAILQGLFELLERDAAAIWWYNRIPRPAFDLSRLNQHCLEMLAATINPETGPGRDFWVLDITNDLGIPAMVAIGKENTSGRWTMGFGCHLIPEMAAQRALTELCQLIAIRNNHTAPFDFDAIEDDPYLYDHPELKATPYVLECVSDIKQNIFSIVAHLNKFNLETLVLNYSRSTIPLSTAKIFVPGLAYIWPQLENERLYVAPINSGWLVIPKTESELNQQALYI